MVVSMIDSYVIVDLFKGYIENYFVFPLSFTLNCVSVDLM